MDTTTSTQLQFTGNWFIDAGIGVCEFDGESKIMINKIDFYWKNREILITLQ